MPDIEALIADTASEGHLFGSREERKYLLQPQIARALRQALAERLRLEAFVPGRPRSRVHSIYFDSPTFALYAQSLAEGSSLKLRLRAYADPAGSGDPQLYLECKLGLREAAGKKKRKLRWKIAPAMLARVVDGRYETLVPETKPEFWAKALAIASEQQLRPRLTVCYEREAFVSDDGRVRVTLDEGYCATRIDPEVASPLMTAQGTLGGLAILEIKLVGALPEWLAELLVAWGVPPEGESFSKYKTAVPLLFPAYRRVETPHEGA